MEKNGAHCTEKFIRRRRAGGSATGKRAFDGEPLLAERHRFVGCCQPRLDHRHTSPDNRLMSFLEWLSSSISTAVVLAVLGFLARHWLITRITNSIKHEYDKELETHKADLKRDYDVQIEKLKAEIAEKNFRFSHTFERTADAIATTYAKLIAVKDAADGYTSLMEPTGQERQKRAENYSQLTQDFLTYFLPKKIYIPKETADKIRIFHNTMHAAVLQYNMAMAESRSQTRHPDSYGKLFDNFFKTSDAVPKLLGLLEDDFQKLLGFPIEKTVPS